MGDYTRRSCDLLFIAYQESIYQQNYKQHIFRNKSRIKLQPSETIQNSFRSSLSVFGILQVNFGHVRVNFGDIRKSPGAFSYRRKKKLRKKTSGETKVIDTPAEYNLEVIVLLFSNQ